MTLSWGQAGHGPSYAPLFSSLSYFFFGAWICWWRIKMQVKPCLILPWQDQSCICDGKLGLLVVGEVRTLLTSFLTCFYLETLSRRALCMRWQHLAPGLWCSWPVITSPVVLLSWLVLTLEQNRWEVPAMLQHVHHHFWLNSRSSSWSNGRRNQGKVRRNGYWRDQECRDLETQRSWDGQNFPHSSRLPIMLLQLGKLWSQLVFEVVMRSSSLSLLRLPKEHVPQRSRKLPERR